MGIMAGRSSSLVRVAHVDQFLVGVQDLLGALVVLLGLEGELRDALQCEWRST